MPQTQNQNIFENLPQKGVDSATTRKYGDELVWPYVGFIQQHKTILMVWPEIIRKIGFEGCIKPVVQILRDFHLHTLCSETRN